MARTLLFKTSPREAGLACLAVGLGLGITGGMIAQPVLIGIGGIGLLTGLGLQLAKAQSLWAEDGELVHQDSSGTTWTVPIAGIVRVVHHRCHSDASTQTMHLTLLETVDGRRLRVCGMKQPSRRLLRYLRRRNPALPLEIEDSGAR